MRKSKLVNTHHMSSPHHCRAVLCPSFFSLLLVLYKLCLLYRDSEVEKLIFFVIYSLFFKFLIALYFHYVQVRYSSNFVSYLTYHSISPVRLNFKLHPFKYTFFNYRIKYRVKPFIDILRSRRDQFKEWSFRLWR